MTNALLFIIGMAVGLELADIPARRRFAAFLAKDKPCANTTPPTTAELAPRPAPTPRRNPSG